MKYLLHLDTSGDSALVAIGGKGKLICHIESAERRNHAVVINTMIAEMLVKAGLTFNDLSGVVVCAGPGSYTGLRIAMGTAKGLCFALDIPLLAHNKLTLLAYGAFNKDITKFKYYIPVLLAREKEYFAGVFDDNFNNITPATHINEDKLNLLLSKKENMHIIGSQLPPELVEKYTENTYVEHNERIYIDSWIFYAFEEYISNKTVNLSTSEPNYLKQVYTHK